MPDAVEIQNMHRSFLPSAPITVRFGDGRATLTPDDGHGSIATVRMRRTLTNNSAEYPAVARLFAASPDLLRELQAFVDRWSKYPKKPTGRDLEIYLDNARAAIAKALG